MTVRGILLASGLISPLSQLPKGVCWNPLTVPVALHASPWDEVVLGRHPGSFRNHSAWWESLLQPGGGCVHTSCCTAACKRDAGNALTKPCISPGVVCGVICVVTVGSLTWAFAPGSPGRGDKGEPVSCTRLAQSCPRHGYHCTAQHAHEARP